MLETREISDSDLDGVSGGIIGALLETAESAVPALPGLPALPGSVISGGAGLQASGPVPAQGGFSGAVGF